MRTSRLLTLFTWLKLHQVRSLFSSPISRSYQKEYRKEEGNKLNYRLKTSFGYLAFIYNIHNTDLGGSAVQQGVFTAALITSSSFLGWALPSIGGSNANSNSVDLHSEFSSGNFGIRSHSCKREILFNE